MKALTLIQPWATLIALGAKRIETRSWATKYTGWLAITASKAFPRDCRDLMLHDPFAAVLEPYLLECGKLFNDEPELPLGAVVCLAHLQLCRPTEYWKGLAHEFPTSEFEFGDFGTGRFGWYFDQVKRLKQPVPCKGARLLWDVPVDLAAAIGAQLP